jgi:cytochrome c oxidase subunit 1
MLFSLGFVILFTIGGFSGLMLAMTPVDFQYHDSYFVVAHFHYVLVPGAVFSLFAAVYYWLPKWTGTMYNEKLGKLHFWWSTVWINVLFFPQHFLGLAGMPRRIPDYNLQFAEFNFMSSVGAFMFFIGQFIFLYNLIMTCKGKGEKATDQVWEGAKGVEWEMLPSPLPYHTFEQQPDLSDYEPHPTH